MNTATMALIDPFVKRGLFESHEKAVAELARSYVLQQIERYQATVASLQAKYGLTYDQFSAYLQARAETLAANPSPELSRAIMREEDDALEWKLANEMLASWLGLQAEAGV